MEVKYGDVGRPNYDFHSLLDTVGYVTEIWVEQEDKRDQVRFMLDIHCTLSGVRTEPQVVRQSFGIFLDRSTTVAFAQLQLLRDAMDSLTTKAGWLVRVHFRFDDERRTYGHVYWVQVIHGREYPTSVNDFYDLSWAVERDGSAIWYYHVED